jgi:hypothetical protein
MCAGVYLNSAFPTGYAANPLTTEPSPSAFSGFDVRRVSVTIHTTALSWRKEICGVNVFGGGLGLYTPGSIVIGGLGVSGDTSCADHNIAWKMRQLLELNHTPTADNISYPAHPTCLGGETPPQGNRDSAQRSTEDTVE